MAQVGSTTIPAPAPVEGEARRLVTIAVAGSLVLNVVAGVGGFFLPGADEAPAGAVVVGVALAVVAAVAAWGLWQQRRWGGTATFWITLVNVVSTVPAIIAAPSAAVVVAASLFVVLSIPLLVLLRRPALRDQLR
jgi:hypothetical protein